MFDDGNARFTVVCNEDDYSIRPDDRAFLRDWRQNEAVGSKDGRVAHIDRTWSNVRPLKLRRTMAVADGLQA
jgi:MbtH protein